MSLKSQKTAFFEHSHLGYKVRTALYRKVHKSSLELHMPHGKWEIKWEASQVLEKTSTIQLVLVPVSGCHVTQKLFLLFIHGRRIDCRLVPLSVLKPQSHEVNNT